LVLVAFNTAQLARRDFLFSDHDQVQSTPKDLRAAHQHRKFELDGDESAYYELTRPTRSRIEAALAIQLSQPL
jgi:hypothetical protein